MYCEESNVFLKLETLGHESRDSAWSELKSVANLTGLRRDGNGKYYLNNWWRGPLMYALISHFRPANVLEFGTGRGYAALAIAKAGADHGFNTTVWTIDIVPPGRPQIWHIDEGDGPTTKMLSLNQVWVKHFPQEVLVHIKKLTGNSASVMRGWKKRGCPSVDMVFIDADHSYWAAKHDFLAALRVVGPDPIFVFDDYGIRPGYGVKRFVDELLLPLCPPAKLDILDMMDTDIGGSSAAKVDHRMAIWNCSGINDVAAQFRRHLLIDYPISYGVMQLRESLRTARRLVTPKYSV